MGLGEWGSDGGDSGVLGKVVAKEFGRQESKPWTVDRGKDKADSTAVGANGGSPDFGFAWLGGRTVNKR